MYATIKQIVLKIFPRKVLFRYEYALRSLYYLFYRGSKYQCNICQSHLSGFVQTHNDQLCPRCGSIQRNRRLWQLLKGEFLREDMKILDFSPSRSLYRVMKKGHYRYESTDLSGDFISDKSYDIQNIDAADENYDLIICYHILEHINDDRKAMTELVRVLKKGGNCLIQTPFKKGEIYEDDSISSPIEREKHFGQFDHVRIYSVDGLAGRLKDAGFQVDIRVFDDRSNINGFHPNEIILIAYKPI